MNVDFVKNQWIPALRSGKYKQMFGKYCNSDCTEFCALGLAANLKDPHSDFFYRVLFDLGLNGNIYHNIANMNDSGKSFLEIADYLEGVINGLSAA
jgi:hypothetical protein